MAEADNIDAPVDIIKLQQEFYEMFGHKSSVIYDCYTTKEALEVKIDLIMPEMNSVRKNALIDLLWEQRKFMGNHYLLMSPIFVIITYDKSINEHLTYPLDIKSKKFSIHPVFRIQKCLSTVVDENGQIKCCAIFIDEFSRAYVNWQDYREKNKYEDGLVIAPKCGIYNGSTQDCVLLDIFARKSGLTKNLDTGSSVVGLASAGVAAAAFIPSLAIAPIFVAGATVAGISCAVYTGLRSAYNLYDRRNHKQSIALKDKEARASWFNIAAGTLSASAAGATQLITSAAQSGQNISHLTRNTIRFMNISALGLHTTGCLDGFHTMLYNFYSGEPISKVHLAQLSASLFLLTHSISNFQTAEQLLRTSDSQDPDSMKQILCRRQKITFQHLVNETALIRGLRSDVGQIIVRSIKSLGDPKELLKFIESNREAISEPTTEQTTQNETTTTTTIEPEPEEFLVKQEDFCMGVVADVITEYCKTFDKRFETILTTLEEQTNSRGRPSLEMILIFLLDDMTFKSFNIFLNFVQELMCRAAPTVQEHFKMALPFECFVKLIYAKFDALAAHEEGTNLNEFILSRSDEQMENIDFDIRDSLSGGSTIESIEKAEKDFDSKFEFKENLSENRKVFLLFDERVLEFAGQFKLCCGTANLNELNETIEDILKRLSYQSATIFFALAKKLINDHAVNIQLSLGRFISVDIFMTDIYCLLMKLSAEHCDSLNEYLFQYTDDLYDSIEENFKQSYVLTNDATFKKGLCMICSGEVFA